MMTPKEALVKDNMTRPESERIPVKEGRGRMSREAVDRIKFLVSQGWDIKGYEAVRSIVTAGAPAVTKQTSAAPVEVKRVAAANVKEVKEFTIFFPEDQYKAVSKSGKEYGMREVCNKCRVSLVQNSCMFPTILGDIAVEIKPR